MLKATTPEVWWGVYDTDDRCWYGNGMGPVLFGAEILAQCAATMVAIQVRRIGVVVARPYDEHATQLRDELATCMSPIEALHIVEGGRR